MANIIFTLNDEVLIPLKTPTVSSGDVNCTCLQITFDDEWQEYTKTAVFFNEKTGESYEKILENGSCTVPHEVMTNANTFLFGVRGVNDALNKIKTSTIVKYKLERGAELKKISEPSPDVYQQLLTAYGNTNNRLDKEEQARKEADSKEQTERIEEIRIERNRITELTKSGTIKTEKLLYSGVLTQTFKPVEILLSEPITNFEYLNITYKWADILETVTVRVEDIKDGKEWFGIRKLNLWNSPNPETSHGAGLLEASMEIKKDSTNKTVICQYLKTENLTVTPTMQMLPLLKQTKVVGRAEGTITFHGIKTIKDTELADIRIGADGVTYDSAGEAIRTQLEKINATLTAELKKIEILEQENKTKEEKIQGLEKMLLANVKHL